MKTLNLLLGGILFATACLNAQTAVYLRDDTTPAPKKITNITEGAGVLVVTAPGHGLSASDPSNPDGKTRVHVSGIKGCIRANGTRTVVSVPDANTVHLRPRDGVSDLTCGGTYTAQGTNDREYYIAKAKLYTLKGNPNIAGFDGPDGPFTMGLAARAAAGHPGWSAVVSRANLAAAAYPTTTLDTGKMNLAALAWYVGGKVNAGYLAAAKKYLNNIHLSQYGTHSGCSTTGYNCGRYEAFDQISAPIYSSAMTFTLIHDQLTTDERNAFLEKFLNDKRLDNDAGSDCSNAYTTGAGTIAVTSGSNTATISPAAGAAALAVGDLFTYIKDGNNNILEATITVTSVDSMTGVVTLSSAASHTLAATKWLYVSGYPVWPARANRCGWAWQSKHNVENPPIFGPYNGTAGYPLTGGQGGFPLENHVLWRHRAYMEVGAVTCQYDVRGCDLYERAQGYFYDQTRNIAKLTWGMSHVGSGSYRGRGENQVATMAVGMRAQLSPSLDVTGGNWIKENLIWSIFQLLPGTANYHHTFGETAQPQLSAYASQHAYSTQAAVSGTTEAAWHRYWLTQQWNQWTQAAMEDTSQPVGAFSFLGVDTTLPATDYRSTLNKQRLWWKSDLSETWLGFPIKMTMLGMASRTSFTDGTATSLFSAPLGMFTEQHTQFKAVGHYQIWKNSWLYASSHNCSIGAFYTGSPSACYTADGDLDSHVEIGRATSGYATYTPYLSLMVDTFKFTAPSVSSTTTTGVQVRRWAGSHPQGRSADDYAYFAWDLDNVANLSVMGVIPTYQRYHMVHVKKGGRDFVVRYVSTLLPSAKAMRTYLHFPNNGQTSEGYTGSDSNGIIRTATIANSSMHTRVLVPTSLSQTDFHVHASGNTLTLNATASASYPVRYQMGGVSCSYTAPVTITRGTFVGTLYLYVKPSDCTIHGRYAITSGSAPTFGAGITDDAVSGWPASDFYAITRRAANVTAWGSAYASDALPMNQIEHGRRFYVDLTHSTTGVGSATSSEYLVTHDIHGNTTDAATAQTQTDSTNWRTVQFDHATLPTIVAVSKGNSCYDSYSFTPSAYSGLAFYVILGLCQGSYSWTSAGGSSGTFTVVDGDETNAFDALTGAVAVTRTGTGPTIATESFPSGQVGVAYSQEAAGVCSNEPCEYTIPAGALPTGLSMSTAGVITGTPTVAGTYNFTLRYTATGGLYIERDFQIVIVPAEAPSFSFSWNSVTCVFNQVCTPNITASGGTPPYSYSATGLPAGVTLNSDGTWTNAATVVGDFQVTITATDSNAGSVVVVGTVRVTTPSGAAGFGLRTQICAPTSCLLRVSLVGFPSSQIISGVVRDLLLGNSLREFTFAANAPSTRTAIIRNLQPSNSYQVDLLGNGVAHSLTLTTSSETNDTSRTVTYEVSASSLAGTECIEVEYGSTSALGFTTGPVACIGDLCRASVAWNQGELWTRYSRLGGVSCGTLLGATTPVSESMVE